MQNYTKFKALTNELKKGAVTDFHNNENFMDDDKLSIRKPEIEDDLDNPSVLDKLLLLLLNKGIISPQEIENLYNEEK